MRKLARAGNASFTRRQMQKTSQTNTGRSLKLQTPHLQKPQKGYTFFQTSGLIDQFGTGPPVHQVTLSVALK